MKFGIELPGSLRARTNERVKHTHSYSKVEMQETSPLSPQSPVMPLSEFLPALFRALDGEGVHFCVLRNYEGFPDNNFGSDVDFLIYPAELQRVLKAVLSIQGIRIVGYMRRSYVASIFLEGTASIEGSRSLQLDFLWSLSWKEMPYLPASDVLQSAMPYSAGNLKFYVPLPVHEAIISLLTSLIYGGWAREKYLPGVQRTFAANILEAIAALTPQFGLRSATRLVDTVIRGDRREIHRCVRPIRVALTLRSLLMKPFRSLQGIVRYYAREIAIRFSPRNMTTVCILCPGDYGKAAIINNLMPLLQSAAKSVEMRHFSLRLPFTRESSGISASADRHAQTTGGSFVFMANIVLWLLEEWLGQFMGKKNITLRLFDNYYHDLLIDPKMYNYRGPMWFARLVGRLTPSPDLWILMGPAAERMQSMNHEVLPAQTLSQLEAYRSFVKTRNRYVVLDSGKPAASVTEEAHSAVIDMLARRANSLIKSRF